MRLALLAFGVVMLALIGVYAFCIAIPFALALSYIFAVAKYGSPESQRKLLPQAGVFFLSWTIFIIVAVVVIFAGLGGNAGSGVTLYGFDAFEFMTPILVVFGGLGFVALAAGEVLLAVRRKPQQPPHA